MNEPKVKNSSNIVDELNTAIIEMISRVIKLTQIVSHSSSLSSISFFYLLRSIGRHDFHRFIKINLQKGRDLWIWAYWCRVYQLWRTGKREWGEIRECEKWLMCCDSSANRQRVSWCRRDEFWKRDKWTGNIEKANGNRTGNVLKVSLKTEKEKLSTEITDRKRPRERTISIHGDEPKTLMKKRMKERIGCRCVVQRKKNNYSCRLSRAGTRVWPNACWYTPGKK